MYPTSSLSSLQNIDLYDISLMNTLIRFKFNLVRSINFTHIPFNWGILITIAHFVFPESRQAVQNGKKDDSKAIFQNSILIHRAPLRPFCIIQIRELTFTCVKRVTNHYSQKLISFFTAFGLAVFGS